MLGCLRRRRGRLIAVGTAAVAAGLTLPSAASAAQVDVSVGGDLDIHMQSNTASSIQVQYIVANDEWQVIGNFVTAGAGCEQISTATVECPENGEDIDFEFANIGGSADFTLADTNLDFDSDILLGNGSEVVTAGNGTDVIHAASTSTVNGDDITALDGDDTITTGNGSDIVEGGQGNDTIVANDGNNLLRGGAFEGELDAGGNDDDNITGGPKLDDIDGGDGVDTLNGGGDPDEITGGPDGDTINAGPGDDADTTFGIDGEGGADNINGGDGDDDLFGGAGNDTLNGDADDDTLDGGENGSNPQDTDDLNGGTGNDTMLNSDGADDFDGGAQDAGQSDVVEYNVASTTAAPMQIDLDNSADDGRNCPATCENDNVRDTNEIVNGDTSADVMIGSSGPNTLAGDGGDDTLSGGQGTGADGADNFDGETGTGDLVTYSPPVGDARSANLTVAINESATPASVNNADGDDLDTIEDLTGGSGGDTLTGDTDANTVSGGPGTANDTVNGGTNNDILQGGTGTNTAPDGADNLNGQGGTGDAASYASRTGSVVVDLDDVADDGNGGCPTAGTCEKDNVASSTENLTGSNGGDTLIGNNSANVLDGGPGGDTLSGGTSGAADGADSLIGNTNGGVEDTVTYAPAGGTARTGAITADADGAAGDDTDGDSVDDSVENLTGGSGGDNLTGNTSQNVLRGGPGTGNDTLSGGDEDDEFFGGTGTNTGPDGADVFSAGNEGANGDEVSYQGRADAIRANIDGAANDGAGGCPGGAGCEDDNIGTTVDNITGGNGADVLIGDNDVNQLNGGGGDDQLRGNATSVADGSDDLNGGADGPSGDTALYTGRAAGVTVRIGDLTSGEDDIDSSIENATGGDGSDNFGGDSTANVFDGGDGNDILAGGNNTTGNAADGADTFIGGPGPGDQANYVLRSDPITARIGGPPGENTDGDDVRGDVEELRGGGDDDVLTGDGDANLLSGEGGADLIKGGTGPGPDGADTMFFGGSTDTLSYENRTDPLTINEQTGVFPDGDVISAIGSAQPEITIGGSGGDSITGGDTTNDTMIGGLGEDDLFGLGGADTLNARDGGPDSLDCGAGTDSAGIDSTTLDTVAPATCENVDDLPETAITAKPRNRTTRRRARFEFNSPSGATLFECSLDGAAFTACTSPQVYTGLSRGRHNFQVRAKDAQGDVDISPATDSWRILRR